MLRNLFVSLFSLLFVTALFVGCNPGSPSEAGSEEKTTAGNEEKAKMMAVDSTETESEEVDGGAEIEADSTETDTTAENTAAKVELDYAAWASLEGLTINCEGSPMNLAVPVNEVAARLEAQNLMYNVKEFTDCSGIFHRVLDSLGRRCPDHEFASPKTHRSSRSVGQWYHEKGDFVVIRDPLNQTDYIKPGAVMFYSSPSINPDTVKVERLFKSGGIRHVGVVVDVEKDEEGNIVRYSLFHGRSTGKVAKTTNYHDREPSRSNYPPYGNGRDHWIGVAPIASDAWMVSAE